MRLVASLCAFHQAVGREVEVKKLEFVSRGGATLCGEGACSTVVHGWRAPDRVLELAGLQEKRATIVALNVGLVAGADALNLYLHPVLHLRYSG